MLSNTSRAFMRASELQWPLGTVGEREVSDNEEEEEEGVSVGV